ncbi:MAG: DUF4837 family protein [Bacteroidetes bacterium]|nr:DUF4837 family protein [Bacteroidota bacterium]
MIAAKTIFKFFTLPLLLIACNTRPDPSTVPSEGMPGEIMVVAEEEKLDEIKDAFHKYYHIYDSTLFISEKSELNQFEPKHGFWFSRKESFKGTEKLAPIILLFGEAGDYTSWLKKIHPVKEYASKNGFSLQVYENVWAKPQTVFRLRFGRDISPANILQKSGDKFLDSVISIHEMGQGLPGNLAPNAYTDSVSRLIENNFGFTFSFTPQFRLVMSNKEVVWLHQENTKFYRDIFVNIFSDSQAINSLESAVENRNLFTKKYLKNAEGTTIKVSESGNYSAHFSPNKTIAKQPTMVLRGWYQEEGTFRRGPFVRYIFHDKKQHRYIAMDGFLHAPNMDRLQLYRTFDHIANTFKPER